MSHRTHRIKSSTHQMESFALAAAHSGAIHHVHTITLTASPGAAGVAREVRLLVTAVVVGWVCVTGIKSCFASWASRQQR